MHDQAQMAYWQKTVKLALYKTTIHTCQVLWILLYDAIGTVFNEDDGTGTKEW
jgi:hypothetical protein